MKRIFALFAALAACAGTAMACTSMIVGASASASGRPLLWKNRDTGAESNFLHRVDNPGQIGYVGLFNGGDTLCLDEAWMGMNDAGFAIMNTVAYNLAPNDPAWTDREGYVMAQALATCRTVDDFGRLLDGLPRPMGLRTCFGVIDAGGNGAYFETDDEKYVRCDLSDSREGVLVRSNYAYSGTPDQGMGYIRHDNVVDLLSPQIATGSITPASFTETLSRQLYNSLTHYDAGENTDKWTVDQDFIPRHSTTASIVVEGLLPGEDPSKQIMWANISYPPCCHVVAVTLDKVPSAVDACAADGTARAPLALEALDLKKTVFPVTRGNGPKYIDLTAFRAVNGEMTRKSMEEYAKGSKMR